MLLFEHKQYLQSCGAESSMQTEISSFKILQFNAYKTTGKGLQRVTSRSDTSRTQINPAPGTPSKGGEAMLRCFRKRKRKLGMHAKIYSYELRFCLLTILMDSQVSKSLKQQFLILLLVRLLSLSLSLSLSHSDRQISSNKLFQLYTYFHTAMRSIINGHACGAVLY